MSNVLFWFCYCLIGNFRAVRIQIRVRKRSKKELNLVGFCNLNNIINKVKNNNKLVKKICNIQKNEDNFFNI